MLKAKFVAEIVERLVSTAAISGHVELRRVREVESFLFEGECGVDQGSGLDIAIRDLQSLRSQIATSKIIGRSCSQFDASRAVPVGVSVRRSLQPGG